MSTSESQISIPNWFRLACCGTPLAALLIATIGVATGATVNPVVFGALSVLSWRVITKVLGLNSPALVINLPTRERSSAVTALRKVS